MPWSLMRRDGEVVVVRERDNKVVGRHKSRAKALRQLRALYSLEKASFGGDRSAAGRYAAEQRWKGHVKKEPTKSGRGKKFTSAKSDTDFKKKYGNDRQFGDGDCFQAAANLLFDKFANDKSARLCHGVPMGRGKIEGIRFDHGWVEVDELQGTFPDGKEIWEKMVYDYSNGNQVRMPAWLYYRYGKIDGDDVKRYTAKEALEKMKKVRFYGPWD